MWSGPRNLSTAMMYSFSARGDCAVWDEPFYGAYLKQTDLQHPMRDEILAHTETNAHIVAEQHLSDIPDGKRHFYFKEMAHHILPDTPTDWFSQCIHVFLIRHPARVITSYLAKREDPSENDIGFNQQAKLFEDIKRLTGKVPTVVDSSDVLAEPEHILQKLCGSIGLNYTNKMLSWPSGVHPDDGPWAPHWYASAWRSTGFENKEGDLPKLPDKLVALCEQSLPLYHALKQHAI